MRLSKIIRYLFLTLYGIITLLFFGSAIRLILNYYLQFSPDKISVELEATLLFSFISIVIGLIFAVLFYLFYKEKKETLILFSIIFFVCFVFFITNIFSADWSNNKEVIFIIGVIFFPSLNLIYLIKHFTNFKLKKLLKKYA
ncbi:MAG: DUF3021 family protein [Ignavibacteriae bacterium]|nr:DUF3021 family protein [Ignavibacteriota bacterium]